MASINAYTNNGWKKVGGVTRLYSESETARNITAGSWINLRSVTLPPGKWIVFGNVRVQSAAQNTSSYFYVTIGDTSGFLKARTTAPMNLGTGNYASLGTSTYMAVPENTTLTVNLYVLVTTNSQTGGEYLNAVKID